jgi:predicted ABC-type ATPase
MIRDISSDEFERLSNEAKKRYIVSLLIKESGGISVTSGPPIAFVMAGLPGAGKTEFLDSFSEEIAKTARYNPFVRIDLDQIVTIYPDYTPKTYAKFRSQGNNVLARCIDVLRQGKYNMMIDGTFSGPSGSSVRNIEKLLNDKYVVILIYMHDKAESAWKYTQLREIETDRGIDKDGFIESCKNISVNLREAVKKFRDNPAFSMSVIKQRELRDKNYEVLSSNDDIDNIIEQGYNIDKLKEML